MTAGAKVSDPVLALRLASPAWLESVTRVEREDDALHEIPSIASVSLAQSLASPGYCLAGRIPLRAVSALRAGIVALDDAGYPPTLIFLGDLAWSVGRRIAALCSSALRCDYVLACDVYAWNLVPGRDRAGWSWHRGIEELTRPCTSPDSFVPPSVLNAWVALCDVSVGDACIWAVPLQEDRDYPLRLESMSSIDRAVPLEAAAGEVLVWDANVLHCGGVMAENSLGRQAASFTLVRAESRTEIRKTSNAPMSYAERLGVVSDMLDIYAAHDCRFDASLPTTLRLAAALVSKRSAKPRS